MSRKIQAQYSNIQTVKKLKSDVRQRKIFELRLKGMSQEKVAKTLGVTVKTIERDENKIEHKRKDWFAEVIEHFDPKKYWIEQIEELLFIKKRLWSTHAKNNPKDRIRSLELIVEIQEKIDERMHSAGIDTLSLTREVVKELPSDIRESIHKVYSNNI
jgi:transposase